MLRPLACTALVALAAARGAAQKWLFDCQEADGHWSAARSEGRAEADLRVTTLVLLTLLADGSTLQQGTHADAVVQAVQWLRAQQDRRGRIGLRADPDWILDHALATYALAEALRTAPELPLVDPVRHAVAALQQNVRMLGPRLGAEELLWCHLVAQALHGGERALREKVEHHAPICATTLGADALDQRLAQVPLPAAATAREHAARFLLDVVAGRIAPPAAGQPELWPADTQADPLATLYVAVGLFRLGGPPWRRASKALTGVVWAQVDGDQRGTWDPVGEFGRQNGRLGHSAVTVLLLTVYYRYCRLAFAVMD